MNIIERIKHWLWDSKRRRLERRIVGAAEALMAHARASGIALPMPSGNETVIGMRGEKTRADVRTIEIELANMRPGESWPAVADYEATARVLFRGRDGKPLWMPIEHPVNNNGVLTLVLP